MYNITVTNTVPYFVDPKFELPNISTVLGKEVRQTIPLSGVVDAEGDQIRLCVAIEI